MRLILAVVVLQELLLKTKPGFQSTYETYQLYMLLYFIHYKVMLLCSAVVSLKTLVKSELDVKVEKIGVSFKVRLESEAEKIQVVGPCEERRHKSCENGQGNEDGGP